MHVPVDEVSHHEERQKLEPRRQGVDTQRHEIAYTERGQQIVEGAHANVGDCCITDGREQEEVEEHVEAVQPEVASQSLLFASPRSGELEDVGRQRNADQGVEVVVETRMRDLAPKVGNVAAEGLLEQ